MKRIVCLVLVFCCAVTLCACGDKNLTFRGIEFGTGYYDAISALEEDLKGQHYNGKSSENELFGRRVDVIYVIYKDVKLYEYDTELKLHFIKKKSEIKENSVLYGGSYHISFKKGATEELDECYKYFYEKLTDLYGKSENNNSGVSWIIKDTQCNLVKSESGPYVDIFYFSTVIENQYEKLWQQEENEAVNNANKGL